ADRVADVRPFSQGRPSSGGGLAVDRGTPQTGRRSGGAPMTFEHPWILLLVLVPAAWAAWEWRSSARRLALVLKAGTFAAIILALAEPRITVFQTKVAVALLADTSDSVSASDLQTESALADQVERARGRHWTHIIPFARNTRNAA